MFSFQEIGYGESCVERIGMIIDARPEVGRELIIDVHKSQTLHLVVIVLQLVEIDIQKMGAGLHAERELGKLR